MKLFKHLKNLVRDRRDPLPTRADLPDMAPGSEHNPYVFNADGQNWNDDPHNRMVFGECPFELDREDPRW